MSNQTNQQIRGTLVWLILGVAAVGFIFWDTDQVKKKKKQEVLAKLLFQIDAYKLHKGKGHKGHSHKPHKHRLDPTNSKDRKELVKAISEIELTSAKTKGKKLVIKRGKYKLWEFSKPFRAPADSRVVDGVLGEVVQGKNKNEATIVSWKKNPDNKVLKKYGLLKPKYIFTLKHKGKAHTLHVGNKDPYTGNYFSRVLGRKEILTVGYTVFNSINKRFFDLRLKHVFTQQTRRIKTLSVTRKSDQLVFERRKIARPGNLKKEFWFLLQPIRALGSKNTINTLLSSLRNLKANKFVSEKSRGTAIRKKFGLDQPAYIVDIIFKKSKKKMSLYVGQKNGKTYVAAASGGPVSLVGNYIIKDLAKPVTDFREKSIAIFKANFVHILKVSVTNRVVQGDNKVESTEEFDIIKLPRNTGAIWKVKPQKGADGPTKKGKAMDLIRKLRRLQIKKFVSEQATNALLEKYGLVKPHRTYQIFGLTRKSLLATIYIGNKDKQGKLYYATDSLRKRIYALAASDVDKLLTSAWQVAKDGKRPKRRPAARKPATRKPAAPAAPVKRNAPVKATPRRPAPTSRPAARPAARRAAVKAPASKPSTRPANR